MQSTDEESSQKANSSTPNASYQPIMAGCLRPMNICRNNQPFPRRHSYPSTPTFTTNPLSPIFPNQNTSNGSSSSIPSTPKSNGIISVYNKTNKRKRCRPSNIPTFKEQPQTKRQKIQTHQLLTKEQSLGISISSSCDQQSIISCSTPGTVSTLSAISPLTINIPIPDHLQIPKFDNIQCDLTNVGDISCDMSDLPSIDHIPGLSGLNTSTSLSLDTSTLSPLTPPTRLKIAMPSMHHGSMHHGSIHQEPIHYRAMIPNISNTNKVTQLFQNPPKIEINKSSETGTVTNIDNSQQKKDNVTSTILTESNNSNINHYLNDTPLSNSKSTPTPSTSKEISNPKKNPSGQEQKQQHVKEKGKENTRPTQTEKPQNNSKGSLLASLNPSTLNIIPSSTSQSKKDINKKKMETNLKHKDGVTKKAQSLSAIDKEKRHRIKNSPKKASSISLESGIKPKAAKRKKGDLLKSLNPGTFTFLPTSDTKKKPQSKTIPKITKTVSIPTMNSDVADLTPTAKKKISRPQSLTHPNNICTADIDNKLNENPMDNSLSVPLSSLSIEPTPSMTPTNVIEIEETKKKKKSKHKNKKHKKNKDKKSKKKKKNKKDKKDKKKKKRNKEKEQNKQRDIINVEQIAMNTIILNNEHKKKVTQPIYSRMMNLQQNVLDELNISVSGNNDKLDLEEQKNEEWVTMDKSIDHEFDKTLRKAMNCISNYVIKMEHVNQSWLTPNEAIKTKMPTGPAPYVRFINRKSYHSSMYHPQDMNMRTMSQREQHEHTKREMRHQNNADWYDDDEDIDLEKENKIRLHRLNLNKKIISLECPYCKTFVQCIPFPCRVDDDGNIIEDNRVAFACFNFPRCRYPFNHLDYQTKYIWDNVEFAGPVSNSKNDDVILIKRDETLDSDDTEERDEDYTYKEITLASFAGKETEFQTFHREQDRLFKKLKSRQKWKGIQRKRTHKKRLTEYRHLQQYFEQCRQRDINSNRDNIQYTFDTNKRKTPRQRENAVQRFKASIQMNKTPKTKTKVVSRGGRKKKQDKIIYDDIDFIEYREAAYNGYIAPLQGYQIKSVIRGHKVKLMYYPENVYEAQLREIYGTRPKRKCRSRRKRQSPSTKSIKIPAAFRRKYNSKMNYKDDRYGFGSSEEEESEDDAESSYSPSPQIAEDLPDDDYIIVDKAGNKRKYDAHSGTVVSSRSYLQCNDDDFLEKLDAKFVVDPASDQDQQDEMMIDEEYLKPKARKSKKRTRNTGRNPINHMHAHIPALEPRTKKRKIDVVDITGNGASVVTV